MRVVSSYILLKAKIYLNSLEDEETEEGSDGGSESEDQEYDETQDDEVVITSAVNLSKNNFETSLDNSGILHSSIVDDDDPVAVFCNDKNPSLEKFQQIKEDDKVRAFKDFLSNAPEDDYLTHLVFTILKLASLGEQSSEAQKLALELFKETFEYAKEKDRMRSVRNFFLIQLGLLKAEEKNFTPKYNVKSCRSALESAIKENPLLPEEEKSIYEVFLNAAK